MGFRKDRHPATIEVAAGDCDRFTSAETDEPANERAFEKVAESCLAWRDASEIRGDARFLKSIQQAIA